MHRKPVEGYPGYYVSDDGRVWSYRKQRPVKGRRGGTEAYISDECKEITGGVHKGYRRVTLFRDGKRGYFKVAVLVLEAFVGPRPVGHHAAHCNGDSSDDSLGNLKWKTARENEADKRLHGTHLEGSRHPKSKLSEGDVKHIRRCLAHGDSYSTIAAIFGVSRYAIASIAQGRTWRSVECDFSQDGERACLASCN